MKREIFRCRCCGHCCHGSGTVSVAPAEAEAMAAHLGISVDELHRRYLVHKGKRVEMRIVEGHCIFYGKDGLCSIHPVKPFPCRQWPLHPSILGDRAAWEAIRKDCPGFAEDADYEDVCRLIQRGE